MASGDMRGRYLAAVEELRDATGRAIGALQQLDGSTAAFVDALAAGASVSELYLHDQTLGRRDEVFDALAHLDRSVRAVRAASFAVIVHDDGLSVADVARRIGRSRQYVSRLLADGVALVGADPTAPRALSPAPTGG